MRACVYGILSICRYPSSIFPADFPRARKIRVNLNSMRSRRTAETRFRRSWPLVNIKQIFARARQESFASAWYIDNRDIQTGEKPKDNRDPHVRFVEYVEYVEL